MASSIASLIKKITIVADEQELSALLKDIRKDAASRPVRIGFVNAHAFNLCWRDDGFLKDLNECDYLFRDGAGMKFLYDWHGIDAGLNMNGTDLIPRFLELYKGDGIALLGTSSPYLENASAALEEAGIKTKILRDGFLNDDAYLKALEEEQVSCAVLSMGMPKQERVAGKIANNIAYPALIICGGAILDFISGRFSRAPLWMRRFGMEWLYRLGLEPRRLFRRYVAGNIVFLWRAMRMILPKGARDPENIKILHVVRQYSPAVGGLETYVENMCRTQKDLGYECTVLTLNKLFQEHEKGLLKEHETINGVHVRRVPFIGARRYFMPFISPLYFKKFDIVHVHNTDVFYDYIAFCSFFLNFKIFATTHGGFFHTGNFAWIKKIYFHTVTRLSSLAYERIFAISDNDFNVFSRISGKITLLPNAIVPAAKKISHGSDFIYIGRLAQNKEIGLLLDMFACLKRRLDGQHILHIAGPEWDVTIGELRTHAEKIGIGDDVIFHGSMDREKLEALIGRCGYFLSASSYEGFGMAMLEAMGAGLIPYVHANEAFKELTGLSGCGLAVDYHRSEETASKIHEHMRSVSMEDRKRAFDFSRQYSWPSLAEKTHGFYLKALS